MWCSLGSVPQKSSSELSAQSGKESHCCFFRIHWLLPQRNWFGIQIPERQNASERELAAQRNFFCIKLWIWPQTVARHTLAILLIWAVRAVGFTVAPQLSVHALAFVALELEAGADGAVHLVAVVRALCDAVATPRHRDAVDLAGGTGELLARAGGRLWGGCG